MHRTSPLAALAAALPLVFSFAVAADPTAPQARAPRVQLALLLDNSGSMQGLLSQARAELWTIVNALDGATRDGAAARIEVALYSYGDPPARKLVPFSGDLDRVSEALFSLGINGSNEYCGQAIDIATRELSWSDDPRDLKLIFIAGNEPFNQGPVRFADAIKRAEDPGIVVSTIHCGDVGQAAEWAAAAVLSGGTSANINSNVAVVHIETPFDREIADLGVALNETYLPYGVEGERGRARQRKQDENALGSGLSSGTGRSIAKASGSYSNATWDLLDAVKEKRVDLNAVSEKSIPQQLRGMTAEQRRAAVDEMQQKREQTKQRIVALNREREAFLKAHPQNAGEKTLDRALLDGLVRLAAKKGFELKTGTP